MGIEMVFKDVDEYTINSFKAYKLWTFTESTITQYSSSANEAVYLHKSVLNDPFSPNSSGLSKTSLFSSVYNAFYKYRESPAWVLGENTNQQTRDISNRASVISISNKYFGERIKPGSINIVDNSNGSVLLLDDGYGNIYDTAVTGLVSNDNLVGYWSFNDGFVTSGSLCGNFENKNQLRGAPSIYAHNVTYTPGVFGHKINFTGESGSYATIENHRSINFKSTEDFAISLWVTIPTSQSMAPVSDNMIVEKWDGEKGYPFCIRVFNDKIRNYAKDGKIYVESWDNISQAYIESTNKLNDGNLHHVVYQKNGTTYSLWVDGVQNGTSVVQLQQTHNNSNLYLGARGYFENGYEQVLYNFKGSIDELRIYSGSLSTAQITTLYTRPSNTNVVGNVFYSLGVMVLTNLSGSYSSLMLPGSNFVMQFKSTVTINENNILVTVRPNEYNMTFNPSAANVVSTADMQYMPFVTSSYWSPYITTIGLYDNDYQLVALAKLTKPIKKPTDIPITFALRWDM